MKQKELFNLAYKIYEEDHKRYNNIDERAAKLFTIFTFFLGISLYLGNWILDKEIQNCFDYIYLIIYFILFINVIISWFLLYSVISLRDRRIIPFNEEMIDYWEKKDKIEDIFLELSKKIETGIRENIKITNTKADRLRYSYTSINCTMIIFIIYIIIIASNEIYKKIYTCKEVLT